MKKKDWNQLASLLKQGELRTDEKSLEAYSGDKWFAVATPEAVALPRTTASVSKVLTWANRHSIPVTARGAGHGYVGGCVPLRNGIVLSLERMKRIREIHAQDFVAVVQAGVITAELQQATEAKGMFYPPDPASRAHCSIGGNIATNAGGPRCLKYGVTRDYLLGAEVVLADGTVVRTGGRTHKNKTGFDLHRIFVGSEGLLGIVTEATLKLLPLPPFRAALSIGVESAAKATVILGRVFQAGFLPSALEIADHFTLQAAMKRTGSDMFKDCRAHIIIELDGQEASVKSELKSLSALIREESPSFINKGMGNEGCEKIWQIRREFSYALRDTGLTKLNEDIVVPRSRLTALFKFAERVQKKFGIPVACFGHAGDGNIHVNVMIDKSDPEQEVIGEKVLDALFEQVLKWNGAITGEHGVGLAKMPWINQALSPESMALHQTLKSALDPRNILNPGKFVQS
ncbi:MAG TPA: FAD/FMN-containing dehydrogenase [Verrucomicrobiales bacterium]|nr:FAD/FMN-containing dehydrogenase [Pedosphaera sp.]MBL6841918.1 FAD-binding oxidoreductase [Verrucomicrobiae bacterium]HAO68344.1 FAD/FMN-containing dehydrogenase [Verrucomicrobiales bacterium]HBP57267.1 FAD/FMN-containing dehydrogenase [Verrucomicrobiales bacterium]HCP38541.1 FAD/FMN-containing dehydrogenase [Verrucomicrobiales bacterium]|tara:strand:+ start:5302 stop:6678 length:1377 start_codon:yes stop_codon:yes gene_type:complete